MILYNPPQVLLEIGPVRIFSWGLMVAIAFIACSFLVMKEAERRNSSKDFITNLIIWIIIGALAGSRLAYVALQFPYYLKNPLAVLMLWQGGVVSYGGIIGGVIAAYLYVKSKKESFIRYADLIAPYIPLGFAIGRIGCFLNWDDYGIASALPWAVKVGADIPRHPTQIYLILVDLLMFAILFKLSRSKAFEKRAGSSFFAFLGVYGALRLVVEPLRDYATATERYTAMVILIIALAASLIYFAKGKIYK